MVQKIFLLLGLMLHIMTQCMDSEAMCNLVENHSSLAHAIHAGNMEILKKIVLLDKKNLREPDEDGFYPLHHAMRNGNDVIVRFLLDEGANPNDCTKRGLAPLHHAVSHNFYSLVKILLDYGAQVNVSSRMHGTALHAAVLNDHGLVIQLLCSYDADQTISDKYGNTPLQLAVRLEKKDSAEYLIYAGANLYPVKESIKDDGDMLDSALEVNFQIAHVLLRAGMIIKESTRERILERYSNWSEPYELLANLLRHDEHGFRDALSRYKPRENDTQFHELRETLMMAYAQGKYHQCILLKGYMKTKGCGTERFEEAGIFFAVARGDISTVQFHWDTSPLGKPSSVQSRTFFLDVAAMRGHVDLVNFLIAHEPNKEASLHCAVDYAKRFAVEVLLNAGASPAQAKRLIACKSRHRNSKTRENYYEDLERRLTIFHDQISRPDESSWLSVLPRDIREGYICRMVMTLGHALTK